MDWPTNLMTLQKELDRKECKFFVQNLTRTDNTELNHYSHDGSFTCFDSLVFQDPVDKLQKHFNVTKVDFVNTGLIVFQKNSFKWVTIPPNTQPRYLDDREKVIDTDIWSINVAETSRIYDDKQDGLILEGHTLQCLDSDFL